jgi:folate-binding protein YgfZ
MTIEEEVRALRASAAVIQRPDVRTLELTGPDRVRFLEGMVSNNVSRIRTGEGAIALKTTNKGRIEGVLRVRADKESLFIDVSSVVADRVRQNLDQLIIMDDCAIADVSDRRRVISVFGPSSRALLGAPLLADHAFADLPIGRVIRDAMLGLEGYEAHVPVSSRLFDELLEKGATSISPEALDTARIEQGVPLDGRDLEDTIPMEARLERALDFDKGCYVGQEVIARAHNLGGVKHILVGLVLEGETVPERDATILLADKTTKTGGVTSSVRSPTLGKVIALGYVKRSSENVGTELFVALPSPVRAHVALLPFVH